MQLTHRGSGYSGIDPDTGQAVNAAPGETIDVGERKAHQLQADFPAEWERPEAVKPQLAESVETREVEDAAAPKRTKPQKATHTK